MECSFIYEGRMLRNLRGDITLLNRHVIVLWSCDEKRYATRLWAAVQYADRSLGYIRGLLENTSSIPYELT
jgi:hypothetical protein